MVTRRIIKLFVVLIFCCSSITSHGQGVTGENISPGGPRAQLATIVFAGLGGAILGLSTLSFYGRPQDKLSNIAVGFALGIIGGTIFTTYRTATNPYGAGGYDEVGIIETKRDVSYWESTLAIDSDQALNDYSIIQYNHTWTF